MTALPVVPQVLKCELLWTYGDKDAANILHFLYTGGPDASLAFVTAVATTASTGLADLAPIYHPDVTAIGAVVTDLSSDTGYSVQVDDETPGTRTGGPLPANAAVLGQYSVARRYRGGHARTYWPWFTATDIDTPQTWTSGAQDAAEAGMSGLLTSIRGTVNGAFSIVEQVQIGYRPVGRVPKTSVLVDGITYIGIAQEIASMRRRDGRH